MKILDTGFSRVSRDETTFYETINGGYNKNQKRISFEKRTPRFFSMVKGNKW